MEDHTRSVSRSSVAFLSGTLISRFSGMLRDISMAFCFGSHPAIAAFMVSFRFANLIRRLFGEGPLPSGFIPHFEQLRGESSQRGAQFFRDLFFSLTVLLVMVVLLLEAGLFAWIRLATPGTDTVQILFFTMLMLPGVLFICLFALSCALLQCEKKYFITGVAPIAFNAAWIMAAWWLKDREPLFAAVNLSVAVSFAFLMQWLMVAPQTFSYLKRFLSWKELIKIRLFSPEMRLVIKPFLLSVIGVGAVQINSALDSIFARFASLEGPAYLWYAIRLQQVPLALFGIALSTALLPPLSRAIKEGSFDIFQRLIDFSLRRSFSLIFPCTIGLLVLGASGINLLYGHGDFDFSATWNTIICLWGYGIGLVPAVFVLLFAPAFYAQKDYRTPTLGALFAVLLNLFVITFLVFVLKLGPFSIAVATSICAAFNCIYLARKLAKKTGPLFTGKIVASFLKTIAGSLFAGAATLTVGYFLAGDPTLDILLGREIVDFTRQISQQILQFLILSGTFALTFIASSWAVKADDALELFGLKRGVAQAD